MLNAPTIARIGSVLSAAVIMSGIWAYLGVINTLISYASSLYWGGSFRADYSVGDLYTQLGAGDFVDVAVLILCAGTVCVLVPIVVVAFTQIPRAACIQGAWASYGRAWAVVASTAVAGTLIVFVVGLACGTLGSVALALVMSDAYYWVVDVYSVLEWLTVLLAFCAWLGWIGLAMREFGHKELTSTRNGALRCEGCGYDLRAADPGGRCPECGRPVSESSVRELARPGPLWEQRRTFWHWRLATYRLLCRPSRFYRKLPMGRHLDPARSFARRQFWLTALVFATMYTLPWLIYLGIYGWYFGQAAALFISSFVKVSLIAWFVHRVFGALVCCWWLARTSLPDPRWAAKIVNYEAVFLPAFALANVAFAVVVYVLGTMLPMSSSAYVFSMTVLGMRPQEAAWLGLNLALIGIWLWRYRCARIAVQWCNH